MNKNIEEEHCKMIYSLEDIPKDMNLIIVTLELLYGEISSSIHKYGNVNTINVRDFLEGILLEPYPVYGE